MTCQASLCDRPVYARGHCSRHYRQVLRHGAVQPDRARAECAVGGCGRVAASRGWCHGHYLRWRRTGDVQAETALRRSPRGSCSVPGCARDHQSSGLCEPHRQRLRSTGAIEPGRPLRGLPTGAHLSHGYRRVMVTPDERWLVGGATTAAEHRLVVARLLGRPLTAQESVHHRNGDRTDNRPANLELWSRFQPTGARVQDQVAWALEVLRRHAPELLAAPGQQNRPAT